ncbi:DUF2336 domain-containing protein [Sphingomonas sp. 10B4]|uniref:DUF2336 domain-containing protein n=1 Tax=Sphingomonas sp. 10B4 TaxID=3048575 RepID=UPI002AB354B5|nr:DUF2336 domain-containing protein [Sphingomonas sp. 10B4]MDY7522670.1 DUF2336 domain-containing protein [Sphingomonas sp. 10B4]MEB0281773.1 DUF2336 domain-containing protein [Sphingomonas sp. 10B4]
MSIERRDIDDGAQAGAMALLARAAAADGRADSRLRGAIDDFYLSDHARLDDRTRLAMGRVLDDLALGVEAALRGHAARLLAARAVPHLADALGRQSPATRDRLIGSGLMRDPDLMRELFGRVRQDLLADALPSEAPEDPDRASLLPRLVGAADGVVAAGAMALLSAESRRRIPLPPGQPLSTELPAELHHRLVWWVAAVLRERFGDGAPDALAQLDRALSEAALRSIAAHDEGERLEAVALRLAAALDPQADEFAGLLVEALADRRLALFIALLAHAMGIDYDDAREIVLDPGADRLWLLLRALELDRQSIARIGLALSEADPARDIDRFADGLDVITAIDPVLARQALAPLLLHRDYRAALVALGRGR